MKKRMLTLLLAVIMVLTLVPFSAFADRQSTVLVPGTRYGIVNLLYQLSGSPATEDALLPFTDVTAEQAPAVRWAWKNHVSTGTSDTTFRPDEAVSRATVAGFLWSYYGRQEPSHTSSPYLDVLQDAWYFNAVLWTTENGLIDVSDCGQYFRPDEQVAHIVGQVGVSGKIQIKMTAEHTWGTRTVVQPASCEEPELLQATCTVCGLTGTIEGKAALGHDYGEWMVIEEPTPTEYGIAARVCSRDPSHVEYVGFDYEGPMFDDVDPYGFYYSAVDWAVNHSPVITQGTGGGKFSPDANCTRGEMVTFLWRAMGCPEPENINNPFWDVSSDMFYYKPVLWAVQNGITNGTSETTFSPYDTVDRAQTVTFLWRMAGSPAELASIPFWDVLFGQYYTNAILWAVKNHITNGLTATTFGPTDPCTRAQIVTFLWRAMA